MAEQDKPTDENFLGRWSRLKHRRETEQRDMVEPEAAAVEPEPAATPDSDLPVEPAAEPGEPVAVEDLPDVDSLNADSDYTGFLKPGVPELLRRKALRTLWRSNPVFANLDGLNDYDEDFSAVGIIAQEVSSLYKVGKGMLGDADTESEREGGRDKDEAEASDSNAPESEVTESAASDARPPTSEASATEKDAEPDDT